MKTRGGNQTGPRLNPESVREMRAMYHTGEYTYRDLAKIFQVALSTAEAAVRGDHWRSVK